MEKLVKASTTLVLMAISALVVAGCVTPDSPQRMSLNLAERDADTCADVARDMELVNRYQMDALASIEYSRGTTHASSVPLTVSSERRDMMELQAAWKSSVIRRDELDARWESLQCEGPRPTYTGVPACTGLAASWHYDRKPGKACARFTQKERQISANLSW